MRRCALALLAGALTWTAPLAGSAQQPGSGPRPRPGTGRAPEFPPPTILEYQPRSTLIVPAHPVPRARYPVVDIHGHPPALLSPEVIELVGKAMDQLNLRVLVSANGRGMIRPAGKWIPDGRAKHLAKACEASLLAMWW